METTQGKSHAHSDTILGGKYRIERVIGEGAFGRVYLAYDPLLRRNTAVKELLASRTTTDPTLYEKYLDRFQREARAAGRLEHPNVVGVYELAVDKDGNYYLVMQYVDGTNLRDLLAQVGTLPVERAASICLDIAQGLAVIHEQDIVHRDLKPANIMLTSRGTARITDFGIAQVGQESLRTQVATGHPGTPMYMSPEQTSGFSYIDGRSDLYSLGLVLYEMLVGEPYARRRRPLAQVRPDLPPSLYGIVNGLTEVDPARRYQNASNVVTDLQRLPTTSATSAGGSDPYRVPGIHQTPSGQPIWQGAPSQPPIVDPVGGVPASYNASAPIYAATSSNASPPVQPFGYIPNAWDARPTPPPPLSRDQVRILGREHVRVRRAGNGIPEYVVDNGAILRKILLLFFIALVIWIVIPALASGLRSGSPLYGILLGIWVILMVSAPIALVVKFLRMRRRARAFIRGIQGGQIRR